MEFRPMTCFWNNLLSGQKMGNENILNVSGSKKTTVLLSTMFYTLFIDVVLCTSPVTIDVYHVLLVQPFTGFNYYFQLMYSLKVYKGDEKIKEFSSCD